MTSVALIALLLPAFATAQDDLRLALSARPETVTTGTSSPREGRPCQLVLTVTNVSPRPVILRDIQRAGRGLSAYPDTPCLSDWINARAVKARSLSSVGRELRATFDWVRHAGTGSLESFAGGGETQAFTWVSRQGILLPGETLERACPWVPGVPSGELVVPMTAAVAYRRWTPGNAASVWVLDPRQPRPEVPAWCRATTREPPPGPFSVSFVPALDWNLHTRFEDGLISNHATEVSATARLERRFVLDPGSPPLRSLLPRWKEVTADAVFSPELQAWFLTQGGRTRIVRGGARFEIGQDVVPFIRQRLLAGEDRSPWALPQRTVPPAEILDELLRLDAAGARIEADGEVSAAR